MRDLRDLIEEGALHTEPSYLELRNRWEECFAELRTTMRNDINTPTP
ncbi:hypothetical protein ACWCXK_37525 [Streptomyces sp. NPDC001739]